MCRRLRDALNESLSIESRFDLGPAVWRVLDKCHHIRNLGEYEGFSNFPERKLMDRLNRLGYDIEIRVRETAEPIGHLVSTPA